MISSPIKSQGKPGGSNEDQPGPLWEFIPFQEYLKPSEPASEAARSRMAYVWRRLRSKKEETVPTRIDAELHSIPQQLLDAVAPPPDWQEASEALATILGEWPSSNVDDPAVKVVVGPPGAGVGQILSTFAPANRWKVIDPPTPEQILEGRPAFGWEWMTSEQPFVLPSLERWFLRHHRGLTLIRQLFSRITERKKPCLLGCDSWAWRFLTQMRGGWVLPGTPLTLKAFDDRTLMAWFGGMAGRLACGAVTFRQSDNGKLLFSAGNGPSPNGQTEIPPADQGPAEPSEYLKKISGRSRGIPLVAWSLWRNALAIAAEDDIDGEALKAERKDSGLMTIWVKPWERIGLPQIPMDLKRVEQFILQALLLHGALSQETMALILFQSLEETTRCLYRLAAAGLVKREKEIWRVTLFGYPAIHQYLDHEGFVTDGF